MMSGSKDIDFLLENMSPEIIPGEYVFSTVNAETLKELSASPILIFREKEATTVVVTKDVADIHSLSYENTWGLITLSVHSNLSAIGFLAEVTRVLAKAGLSVNVVSAFYHDHLFVPYNRTSEALSVLLEVFGTKAR
ncbi:MAG: ACT domain-containing protein [Candidatus Thorarchaeota archaeon]